MDYKAIVVGGGPAGYTAAIRLAQLGAKVVLIERDEIGGICINWGCTPSKAMIASAKVLAAVKSAGEYGIRTSAPQVDFKEIAARRDKIILEARSGIAKRLDDVGVEVVKGTAEYISATSVKVGDRILTAENIVIATGSEPLVPGFFNQEDPAIINSNKLITIKELPKNLTIVGGGIIGLEFATMFAHFGTNVRIIELLDRCLFQLDPEISKAITEELEKAGVEIFTGHKVLGIKDGKISLEKVVKDAQGKPVMDRVAGETFELDSPLNLIAIGRKAVIANEQLEKIGVSFTPKGISVDDMLRTSVPGVYAIGDATGLSILAHVGIMQGVKVAENIMGAQNKMDYSVIPAVVYTLPEIATVGTVPASLDDCTIHKYPFSANLRAHIDGHDRGFVKIWVSKSTGKLLACQIIGDYAGEIIQGFANILQLDTELWKVAYTIHAHPTYNEIVKNTIELALSKSVEY